MLLRICWKACLMPFLSASSPWIVPPERPSPWTMKRKRLWLAGVVDFFILVDGQWPSFLVFTFWAWQPRTFKLRICSVCETEISVVSQWNWIWVQRLVQVVNFTTKSATFPRGSSDTATQHIEFPCSVPTHYVLGNFSRFQQTFCPPNLDTSLGSVTNHQLPEFETPEFYRTRTCIPITRSSTN